MSLDNKLIKDFIKVTSSDADNSKNKNMYYGSVIMVDDTPYVTIDGSNQRTPITAGLTVKANDRVAVYLENHAATVIGNISNPPTDDALALQARQNAANAQQAANEARESAFYAAQAAEAAQTSATTAIANAGSAQAAANIAAANAATALQDAATADGKASDAILAANAAAASASDASSAASSALSAAQSAASAASAADAKAASAIIDAARAEGKADAAASAASRANIAANSALTNLAIVQDVAGTLQWISSHGTYTQSSDTEVDTDKIYFQYDSTSQDYVPIVSPDTTLDPSEQGWYELSISDSQTDYIMSHLAVTSSGLWVLPAGMGTAQSPTTAPGYKLLLSSSGMKIYDASGNEVSEFSESITFSSNRPQYIGGEDAYIVYYDSDNDGIPDTIRIGGDKILLGGDKTLTELLSDMASNPYTLSIEKITLDSLTTVYAKLMSKGLDVTRDYNAGCYYWYLKENGLRFLGRGYSIDIDPELLSYGKTIVLEFIKREQAVLLDGDGNKIMDASGNYISGYTEVD